MSRIRRVWAGAARKVSVRPDSARRADALGDDPEAGRVHERDRGAVEDHVRMALIDENVQHRAECGCREHVDIAAHDDDHLIDAEPDGDLERGRGVRPHGGHSRPLDGASTIRIVDSGGLCIRPPSDTERRPSVRLEEPSLSKALSTYQL